MTPCLLDQYHPRIKTQRISHFFVYIVWPLIDTWISLVHLFYWWNLERHHTAVCCIEMHILLKASVLSLRLVHALLSVLIILSPFASIQEEFGTHLTILRWDILETAETESGEGSTSSEERARWFCWYLPVPTWPRTINSFLQSIYASSKGPSCDGIFNRGWA